MQYFIETEGDEVVVNWKDLPVIACGHVETWSQGDVLVAATGQTLGLLEGHWREITEETYVALRGIRDQLDKLAGDLVKADYNFRVLQHAGFGLLNFYAGKTDTVTTFEGKEGKKRPNIIRIIGEIDKK